MVAAVGAAAGDPAEQRWRKRSKSLIDTLVMLWPELFHTTFALSRKGARDQRSIALLESTHGPSPSNGALGAALSGLSEGGKLQLGSCDWHAG